MTMGTPMTTIIMTTITITGTGTPVATTIATTTQIIPTPPITGRTSISAKAPLAPKCRG